MIKIEKEIATILNKYNDENEINKQLKEISQRRRGENRVLIAIVSQLVDVCNTPIIENDKKTLMSIIVFQIGITKC